MHQDDQLLQSLASLTPELKGKLAALLAQDSSIAHSFGDKRDQQQITALRRSNAKLQQDLYKTLSDFRNAEKLAKEQISTLDTALSERLLFLIQ